MKTQQEKLTYTVENFLNEEQCSMLNEIIERINHQGFFSKKDLEELSFEKEYQNKIDSALPNDYVKSIQKVHPNFDTSFHVFNYNHATFGEMTNVAETFIKKLVEVFKLNH